MPAVSQAQRRLMFAAAAKPGGVGGVPQSVGQDFANADQGGKLPAHVESGKPKGKMPYTHARKKRE